MQEKYKILTSLSVKHNYHTINNSDYFKVKPNKRTSRFLKNYKLLFKTKNHEFIILQQGREENGLWRPIINLDEDVVLEFVIKVSDPLFQTKTKMEYAPVKDFKFCLLLDKNKNDFENYSPQMLPFVKGGIPLNDFKSTKTTKMVFKHELLESQESFMVDKMSNIVVLPEMHGTYSLSDDQGQSETFIWNGDDDNFDGFLLMNINSTLNQKFKLRFQNRSIQWKFVLISKYATLESSVMFKEEQGLIEFDKELFEMESKEHHFLSKEEVPLHDRYNYNFFVEQNGEKIKTNIGAPSLNKIERVSKNNNNLVLVSYITI
jgi:hypothetical protein